MVKMVLIIMGAAFILIGLIGFVSNNFLGTHLSLVHNLVHLGSGAASLFLGLKGSVSSAKLFAYAFGALYLLLGIAGFAFGMTETVTLPPDLRDGFNERMLRLIPGHFELGTVDYTLHILIGLVYLVGAAITRGTNLTLAVEGNPE